MTELDAAPAFRPRPILLVVSAPSGAGKTTLCDRLRGAFPVLRYSVSCTTRVPREGERDGVHYFFLEEAEFFRRIEAGAFLEFARVHGHWYGTPRAPVAEALAAGRDVLMDIDVQGAAQIRESVGRLPAEDVLRRAYVDVFVAPPSLAELRRRLEARAKDAPDVIERRLVQAKREMADAPRYDYLVVNDVLDDAFDALRSIVVAEHHRAAPR
jgi:guanylate kinase